MMTGVELPEFPDYRITEDGQIWSLKRAVPKPLALSVNGRWGYLKAKLVSRDGELTTIKVHTLVALAYLGDRPADHQINHINGDKKDNRASNLEYCTASHNVKHAHQLGLIGPRAATPEAHRRALLRRRIARTFWLAKGHRRGASMANAKLTSQDVEAIRAMPTTRTLQSIADEFHISTSHARRIRLGLKWKRYA